MEEKNLKNPYRQLNGWEAMLLGVIFLTSIDLVKCWINSKVEREKLKYNNTREEDEKKQKRGLFS